MADMLKEGAQAEAGVWAKPTYAAATHGEVDVLRQRLLRAEREVRTTLGLLKVMFCLAIAAAIGATVFTASRSYATLHEGSTLHVPFQVVDSNGGILLRIDADQVNRRFRLFDAAGQAAVELGSTPDGGILNVTGPGNGSALLLANSDGGQLTVTGKKSTPIAWLGGRQDSGTIAFWDETGRQFFCMSPKKQIRTLNLLRGADHPSHAPVRVAVVKPISTHKPAKLAAKSTGKHQPAKMAARPTIHRQPVKIAVVPPPTSHHAVKPAPVPASNKHHPVKTAATHPVSSHKPVNIAAHKPEGGQKWVKVATARPVSGQKPIKGVIGTAVRGQLSVPSRPGAKVTSIRKLPASPAKKVAVIRKAVKVPLVKAARGQKHGKPIAPVTAKKPAAHRPVKLAQRPAAGHKSKPVKSPHAAKPLPVAKARHHWRHRWRAYRGHHYRHTGSYTARRWSYSGRHRYWRPWRRHWRYGTSHRRTT